MRVFLIAGEASGDALGAALMAGLAQLAPGVTFTGVGGERMAGQGLASMFPMDELSVMGLAEILPRYRQLKRRIRECAEAILRDPPDVVVTIDSPDFCLRVARLVRERSDVRIVHYVAPTVWAWRPKRAARMAQWVDQVLALFPFEPEYMRRAGMECDFVGHPVTTAPQATAAEAAAFRQAHDLGDADLLLLLPGSRRGEVSRLAPVLGETLARFSRDRPGLRAVLVAAPPVAHAVAGLVADWPVAPVIVDPRTMSAEAYETAKQAAFRAATVAVAASGTVSLELAAADTPMVIAYDMNPLTRAIIRSMLLVDTTTLVNLVSETRVVPEFLGRACRPDLIAAALSDVLANPGRQREAMALTMDRLGRGGTPPGLRAAAAVLDGLARHRR